MKILCLPYTHTLSHISRLLVVAKMLRERGHEIVFAGGGPETKSHFIEEEGFPTVPYFQVDPGVLFRRIRAGKIKFIEDDELEKMIRSDLDVYQQTAPDLILADGRFTSPISAGSAKIAHAAIVNVSSTEYRALPYVPFFEWLPKNLAQPGSWLRHKLDRVNLKLEMFLFDNLAGSFKRLSKRYGLEKTVTATNCLTGNDLTLMPDIPEYFPTANLPENYHYIGPLTWKKKAEFPSWWPPETGGRKLIYVSMGTTWIGGSFSALVEMIRRKNLAAIITTGGQLNGADAEDIKTVQGEIYIEDYLPGAEVMELCDLVVCHGGNGTIYQAMEQGKPVIGIPTIPDQDFNMRRVEALGLGIKIEMKALEKSPAVLSEAIDKILTTPGYKEKAAALQKSLRRWNAPEKAPDLLEKYFSP